MHEDIIYVMLQFAHRTVSEASTISQRFACMIHDTHEENTVLLCYASLLCWESNPPSALMFTLALETPIFDLMVETFGYVCN